MIADFLTAFHTAAAYFATRWRRFSSREQLERWQDRRVQKHLRHVLARSPYYRELFDGIALASWRECPVTTKVQMMRDFTRFNTLGASAAELTALAETAERTRDFRPRLHGATVGLSTGTSGVRSLFLASPRDCGMFLGSALAKLLRGELFAPQRIALFHRSNSNLYRGLNAGWLRYEFFNLANDIEQQFSKLEAFNPTILIGPPHAIRLIGAGKRTGKAKIAPRRLLSVAEVLELPEQNQIESDFDLRLDQAYIATEGFIAATCPEGVLHLNEDLLVVQREWLDDAKTRFTPVITDFNRRAQPMIRFRLDDLLIARKGACSCGSLFAMLDRIEGRADDVLIFGAADGNGTRRVFPDFIRRAILNAAPDLSEFRVTQKSTAGVSVEFSATPRDREQIRRELAASLIDMFRKLNCAPPDLEFHEFTSRAPGSKRRRVLRDRSIKFN